MLKIFIGYDSQETVAYHVLAHSILERATRPISITPLVRNQLKDIYKKERGLLESTDFSMTRFLVPYLSDYEGVSIFMDCDMLCLTDISRLLEDEICWHSDGSGVDEMCGNKAVWVCQHDYTPKTTTKMMGQKQTNYPRKNWSSFIIFNNKKCEMLTSSYINTASGLDLHRFTWIDDNQIGSLPLEWNWLVGEYDLNPNAKILHYTLGGPWFPMSVNCDHAEEWVNEYRKISYLTE